MSEEQATPLHKQIGDKVIDARNEVIVQATNVFLFGRQVTLVSLGLTLLGVEQIQGLFEQAAKRGEALENDARHLIDTKRHQLAEGTTANVSSQVAKVLNKVPGVSVAYEAPAQSEEPTTPTT